MIAAALKGYRCYFIGRNGHIVEPPSTKPRMTTVPSSKHALGMRRASGMRGLKFGTTRASSTAQVHDLNPNGSVFRARHQGRQTRQ